eukprot:4832717-Pyramimonas_sp.AAC.1
MRCFPLVFFSAASPPTSVPRAAQSAVLEQVERAALSLLLCAPAVGPLASSLSRASCAYQARGLVVRLGALPGAWCLCQT